ncbi:CBO0543 family protein [Alkaliphilus metalliredigens]|nr:CBO0543 family protein [Alkaliphilus metalliredigens]
MSKEVIILIVAWFITINMLVLLVPKNKIREAQVIFLFKQLLSWLLGLIVAQYKLIEYPVRLFSYANKASFTFEFFIFPALCVVFVLYYPERKSHTRQFMYYLYFCTAITTLEIFLEKYTNVIGYIHWAWYLTWITLFLTFYASRKYYVWFFRLKPKEKVADLEK